MPGHNSLAVRSTMEDSPSQLARLFIAFYIRGTQIIFTVFFRGSLLIAFLHIDFGLVHKEILFIDLVTEKPCSRSRLIFRPINMGMKIFIELPLGFCFVNFVPVILI